jgi:hypothetical protein
LVFLWQFGIFVSNWYFYDHLVYCTKKNLASLVIWYIFLMYDVPRKIWQPCPVVRQTVQRRTDRPRA